MMVITEQMKED